MKFASWGDVYFSGLSRGYDPGYAAWKADQWEKRKNREAVKMYLPEVIKEYLVSRGFEGLFCEECGCGLDDLMPCSEPTNLTDCEPCYMVPGCSESCGQGCDFHWSIRKAFEVDYPTVIRRGIEALFDGKL